MQIKLSGCSSHRQDMCRGHESLPTVTAQPDEELLPAMNLRSTSRTEENMLPPTTRSTFNGFTTGALSAHWSRLEVSIHVEVSRDSLRRRYPKRITQ
ncbi:hypothetical protein EVAR_29954_1 [Eumeta japonica]|uniref:Uncharacterized protein n=1 Tax=Eumeta variegata TaxID=151549 RepID=A0A4C1VGJ8_EUMVA|nr:hypothetical protein EVAR_29954_1 [Eumeta japonica]